MINHNYHYPCCHHYKNWSCHSSSVVSLADMFLLFLFVRKLILFSVDRRPVEANWPRRVHFRERRVAKHLGTWILVHVQRKVFQDSVSCLADFINSSQSAHKCDKSLSKDLSFRRYNICYSIID